MYLYNDEWWMVEWRSTLYIKMCIIIMLFLSLNGTKGRFNGLGKIYIFKRYFRDIQHYWKFANILGLGHRTIESFLANSQHGHKKFVEVKRCKLTAKRFAKNKMSSYQEPIIFRCCGLGSITLDSIMAFNLALKQGSWVGSLLSSMSFRSCAML